MLLSSLSKIASNCCEISFNNVICFSIRWRGNNGNVYAILLIEFCCCCYLPTTASLVFEFYLYFNFACVCFCGGHVGFLLSPLAKGS